MMETKQAFAGKMVFIKVDLCTRRKHHFSGIDLQVVAVGYLRIITSAVNELRERATSVAISKNIVSCSAQFCIWEKQIYSLLTDKGSNVLKVGS